MWVASIPLPEPSYKPCACRSGIEALWETTHLHTHLKGFDSRNILKGLLGVLGPWSLDNDLLEADQALLVKGHAKLDRDM